MNQEMFGTLPDGTLYTKRRNLMLGADMSLENTGASNGSINSDPIELVPGWEKLIQGKTITVSFQLDCDDLVFDESTTGYKRVLLEPHFVFSSGDHWYPGVALHSTSSGLPTYHGRLYASYTAQDNEISIAARYRFYIQNMKSGYAKASKPMITLGTEWYPYTPAPEDVTFSGMDQNAVEQGVILWGAYTVGKTYAEMKDDDSDSHKFRLRSAGLVPLLGKASFTINIPSGICVIPYYFDSAGKSLGTVDSSWKTTTQSYTPPTGAVYAAIYFKKSDDSEIVPEDVLEVYIGGGG